MGFFDIIDDWLTWTRSYMLGSGLLHLAVIAAGVVGSMLSIGFLAPALAVAAGGALFNAYMALRAERVHEQRMIHVYRREISAAMGVAPQSITRDHLYAMAKENDIISQALSRERSRLRLKFATSVAAGAATFGLLYFGLAHIGLAALLTETMGAVGGAFASVFGIGIVSSLSSLIINNGIGRSISKFMGFTSPTADERILHLESQVRRGHRVAPEQILGVLVASDPALNEEIGRQYGKSYGAMSVRERRYVAQTISLHDDVIALTRAINAKTIRPSNLVLILGHHSGAANLPRVEREAPPAEPSRGSFVARHGGPRPHQSFRERLASEHAAAPTRGI